MIKKSILNRYREVFGLERMLVLFGEFKDRTNKEIERAKGCEDKESVRLIFHNLRSSSLIFGMKKCSDEAAKIEQRILDGKSISIKDMEKCENIYNKSIKQVENLLK